MRTRQYAKVRRIVGAGAAITLLLTACGGEETEGGDDPGDAAEGEPAEGDDAADGDAGVQGLLEGELISMVIPFSTGGGYDTDGRLIGEFLAEELNADVVAENEPGAGGLLAINRIAASPGDGTEVAVANGTGLGGSFIGGAQGVEFDLNELAYIGRLGFDPKVLVVGGGTDYESVDDLIENQDEVTWGATGPGASTFIDILLAEASLGIEIPESNIITGFDGGADIEAALVAGDVDAMVSSVSGRLPLIESGDLRALSMFDREPYEGLEDVELASERDLDEEQETILNAFLDNNELGRPVLASPETPDDILAELRAAFENVVTSDAFQEEAETRGREVAFMSGEEYEELVASLTSDAPEPFVEVVSQADGS